MCNHYILHEHELLWFNKYKIGILQKGIHFFEDLSFYILISIFYWFISHPHFQPTRGIQRPTVFSTHANFQTTVIAVNSMVCKEIYAIRLPCANLSAFHTILHDYYHSKRNT